MDKIYRCIACLGSNCEEEKNIKKAIELMTDSFPDIQWGKTIRTEAEGGNEGQKYSNKAAIFCTTLPCDKVIRIFKNIESQCGRTHEKKCNDIIPIDIDLLQYGEEAIKPDDLKKNYAIKALLTIPYST